MRGTKPVYVPGLVISLLTVLVALIITSSVIFKWSTMPTAPPIMHLLPIIVVPAIPVFAAIAVSSPIITLCAIWIRLSIFTPSWISVSEIEPLSIVVFAPIETLFPINTFPRWAIVLHFLSEFLAFPKPSDPMTAPGEITQLFPIWHPLRIVTFDSIIELDPMLTLSSITQFTPMAELLPILTFLPIKLLAATF